VIPSSDKLSDYVHYFFTSYLPQHRNVSPNTTAGYKQTFIQLLRYWKLRFPDQLDPELGQFQVAPLLDFLSYLEKTLGNTASTRNTRLAAVKSFFKMVGLLQPRYQAQCRQILALPSKRTARRRKPDFLEKNEVDAVFASVDTKSPDGYRDLCILRTLYNTGARASELCTLLIPNLDFDQKQLVIYGKGGKERTVPLWDSTAAFLRTYLQSERRVPLPRFRDFLFINQRRARLTRSGLFGLCSQYLAEAAREAPSIQRKKIRPVHLWRYTTATHLGLAGVDVTVIQEWLGHVSLATTCGYKAIPIQTKREALRKFYLFEQSWQEAKPEGVDLNLYPDLRAFLESL
jgi:site-specific recombinase XerD